MAMPTRVRISQQIADRYDSLLGWVLVGWVTVTHRGAGFNQPFQRERLLYAGRCKSVSPVSLFGGWQVLLQLPNGNTWNFIPSQTELGSFSLFPFLNLVSTNINIENEYNIGSPFSAF